MTNASARLLLPGGDHSPWSDEPVRYLHRRRRSRVTPMGLGLAAGVTFVAGLALAGLVLPSDHPAPAPLPTRPAPAVVAARPVQPSAWVPIDRPLRLYDLSGSGFAKLPLFYEAHRSPDSAERQDVLTFGTFGDAAPALEIAVNRLSDASQPPIDLVLDLARLAAAEGLGLTRIGTPDVLTTRFGPFAVAPVTLRQGAAALPCLGYRLDAPAGSPVAISGLACGTPDHPLESDKLACALDRIDLVSAGDDIALRDVFVAASQRPSTACDTSHGPKTERDGKAP